MRDRQVGMLLVTRDGHLLEGLITDRDLVTRCMALGADPREQVVEAYMNRRPTSGRRFGTEEGRSEDAGHPAPPAACG
jgi:hypothetical protein